MTMPTWDVKTTHWQAADAWRGVQEHEAITEAVRVGERIIDLLNQATTLVECACLNVQAIIDNAHLRCQPILAQLARETDRLEPVLARLQAASRKQTETR
jgi:hypothetical protein